MLWLVLIDLDGIAMQFAFLALTRDQAMRESTRLAARLSERTGLSATLGVPQAWGKEDE